MVHSGTNVSPSKDGAEPWAAGRIHPHHRGEASRPAGSMGLGQALSWSCFRHGWYRCDPVSRLGLAGVSPASPGWTWVRFPVKTGKF